MHSLPPTDLQQLHGLTHPGVRDLAWCCLSAPLMAELPQSDAQLLTLTDEYDAQWFSALQANPSELEALLAGRKSTRLGIYYETLWRFYFSHHPQWRLLAYNLAVQRQQQTLGAFDFLCQRGSEFWHIETAVKFYLCETQDPESARQWQRWLGPNSQDRLDLKLQRLRDHQLPLHQTPEAKQLLAGLFPQAEHWRTGLCLQGYLFVPAHRDNLLHIAPTKPLLRPDQAHPQQPRGVWWHVSDFLQQLDQRRHEMTRLANTGNEREIQPHCIWHALEYHQWFAPIQINLNKQALQRAFQLSQMALLAERAAQVAQTGRPLMIAALSPESGSDSASDAAEYDWWCERQRGIIVPDTWPHTPAH